MKKCLLLLAMLLLTTSVYGKDERKESQFIDNHIFSMDFSFLLKGYDNKGWEFGLSYEQLLFDFLSVKGSFSHTQFWTNGEPKVVTAETISLSSFFYPCFKKFNYIYFGGGCSTDFVQYGHSGNNTVIYLFPQIGWKQNIKDVVLLDVFYRYDFPISNGQFSDYERVLAKQRNGVGISIKFNFSRIFSLLKNK